MNQLARVTGGQHWWLNNDADGIDSLLASLPELGSVRQQFRIITWWDHWLPWSLIVGLLSIEWALRRIRRLP